MNSRTRRTLVTVGVALSLVVGLASIQVAAALTAAAAPPPAPPISLDTLKTALAAEQARGADLQAQLDELNGLTASLSAALKDTSSQVGTEGLTAKQLAARLKTAQGKLAAVQALLAKAKAQLAALNGSTKGSSSGSSGTGSGSGGGGSGGGGSGGTGSGGSATGFSLTLSLVSGDVRADWTACPSTGFTGYALVRSLDPEIHYPPEDRDTVVAQVGSGTTGATDSNAPSGSLTYRVYCLKNQGGETKVAASTTARQITVP
jgi:hypothetical protein